MLQRPTSNVQMQKSFIERCALDVERFFIETNHSPGISFRRALLTWYRKNGRNLPWRHTRDPYAILVSEFMLQQTQVATVIPYYKRWLDRFPDFASLARSTGSDVLHAWQGLGYYTRARNLHATANTVVAQHAGGFPKDVDQIRALPGLGRYTANAVATFAFNQSIPVVEANIGRLLARLLDLQTPIDSRAGRERIWDFASDLVPKRDAAIYNSALMDLGALVCKVRQPRCDICPVRKFCRATNPASLPLKNRDRRPLNWKNTTVSLFKTAAFCSNNHAPAGAACGFCHRSIPQMQLGPRFTVPNSRSRIIASAFRFLPKPLRQTSRIQDGVGSRSTCSLPSRCHHHIAAPSMPSWSNILFRLPTSRNVSASRQIRGASK